MAYVKKNILVIKHGALGDFILSFGPFASIRRHHPRDHIVLLTNSIFKIFSEDSGYFDEIIIDDRPKFWNFKKIFLLGSKLRKRNFYRVYDLQTSDRSDFYYNFFRFKKPKVEWSGTALGCTHPDKYPNRNRIHTIERHIQQLADLGITNIKLSDFSWVKSIKNFNIKKPYVLFSPGSSPHRHKKRWSEQNYSNIGKKFLRKGITPVIIGEGRDKDIADFICMNATGSVNLIDKTTIQDICVLAREANLAIGNDTGPMHAIAMSGCNVLVLFSSDSDPVRSVPRSISKKKLVKVLFEKNLKNLRESTVLDCLHNDFGYNL